MRRQRWRRQGLVAFLGVCIAACGSSKDDSDKASTKTPTTKPSSDSATPTSARKGKRVWAALLDHAARAELVVGGPVIDFGTADQHKYTRGGWLTGWGDNTTVKAGDTIATVGVTDAKRGLVRFTTRAPMKALHLRAAARKPIELVARIDGKVIGRAALGRELAAHELTLDAPIPAGDHEIELRTGRRGLLVDWLALVPDATTKPTAPLPRVVPVRAQGRVRRALIGPTARAYSFYLPIPAKASFAFDYTSKSGGDFEVSVEVDGAKAKRLFTAKGAARWQEASVDLSAYAGRAVRLTLRSTGKGSSWGEPELLVPGSVPAPRDTKKAKSAIFILIDTVRADVFASFNAKTTTKAPAFAKLAAQATTFSNAYNNENWTKPSVATTLSGLYPATHNAKRDASKLPDEVMLLPQHLTKHGVTSAGFVANGFVSEKFGFEKGWTHFRNYIRESKPSAARIVYRDALAWLKKNADKRFFLYIQTIDPHAPLDAHERYIKPYYPGDYKGPLGSTIDANEQAALSRGKISQSDDNLAWLRALYQAEVTYHDEHMGLFLAELDKLGLADDVVLVVTNDHGEENGDHGKFGHGHALWEEVVRAPLTMRLPGTFRAGHRIDEVVEHVDLTPTLLDVLGLPPMANIEGRSLMPLVRDEPDRRPYYALIDMLDHRRAIRVGRYKLALSDVPRLYDLSTDPGEKDNLAGKRPVAQRMCEVYLGEGLGTPRKVERQLDATTRRRFKASKVKISGAVRRRLEALGYFGDH